MPQDPATGPMSDPEVPMPDREVERALVVVAHPDDIDFGSAGTIAGWTSVGIEVTYLLVTTGDAGGFDDAVARTDLPAMRMAEQRAAGAEVGVHDVRFLGHPLLNGSPNGDPQPDGFVEVTPGLRRDISRVIRQVRPNRVLVSSPEWNLARMPVCHPDHMHTGEATLRAVYPDARNPYAHVELLRDEGLEPWTVHEIWVQGGRENNHVSDVTAHVDVKMRALAAHASQFPQGFGPIEELVRAWMGGTATDAGLAEGSSAEIFDVHHIG